MKISLSRVFFSLTVLLSSFFFSAHAQDTSIAQYISKYKAIAEEEMDRTGVPAAISLAQGIVESQAGQGWLVEHSRNHFGIKCKADWTGQTILYDDDKKNECFRVYSTDDSSWRDHSDFLRNSPRYAFLFKLDPLDYKAWAYGLKTAGYATSKVYAEKLITYIEQYNLQQFSEQAIAGKQAQGSSEFATMLEKKIQEDQKNSGFIAQVTQPIEEAKPEPKPSPYPEGQFTINGRRVLYLPQGTSLISIADKYHIRLAKLLRFNELNSDVLPVSTLIFLQKKSKKGVDQVHVVGENETIRSVAAEEGIQVKWLCKWNHLSEDDLIKPGEALYLRGYKPKNTEVIASGRPDKKFFQKVSDLLEQQQAEHAKAKQAPSTSLDNQDTVTEKINNQNISTGTDMNNQANVVYHVQAGDTLYKISQLYKTTVSQIKQWNALQGDSIKPGQQLIVKK